MSELDYLMGVNNIKKIDFGSYGICNSFSGSYFDAYGISLFQVS